MTRFGKFITGHRVFDKTKLQPDQLVFHFQH